jgi:PleD family two-component response regulator
LAEQTKYPQRFSVTCSFGVAPLEPSLEKDMIISNADKALYDAKKEGKNRVLLFESVCTMK